MDPVLKNDIAGEASSKGAMSFSSNRMDKTQVLKLAELSRIRLTDAEAEKLSGEFAAILGYVGEVQSVSPAAPEPKPEHFPIRNVLREDSEGQAPGLHTEKLLHEAPASANGFVKVKKIL